MPNVFQTSANALNGAIDVSRQIAQGGNLGFAAPQMNSVYAQGGGNLGGTNLQPYMNPYTQGVINRTMGTLQDQYKQSVNNLDAQATAAGAFGGSRHGVAQAQGAQNYYDTVANTAAGLNQQNFNQAQQGAMFDIGNRQQSNQFNAGQMQQANQINAGNQLQTRLANQGAAGNMMNTQLSAAGQLGSLSNLGFGMGQQVNAGLAQAGAQQQGLLQQLINAGRGQYGGFTGAPMAGLGAIMSAVGGAPGGGGTQTQSSSPGLLGMFSGVASGLGALGSAGLLCWVARASFGEDDGRWLKVRQWMLTKAPLWLFRAYVKHGPKLAEWIERHPASKPVFRRALSTLTGA
ncbi:hypothetical protein [Paracoccus sulfuroxidans]|uniref:Uncharacterized protein n=1 Tax=Paracoccus sulfuroxidans TaxID=384678 RepID=A0A562NKU6_9RHOB|nr:hypothetical protein [Paracoccus sulfuroxidans]TWI32743.1 hypothetical protein IQ24_02618 [Paracoccus sulfuroxidans]